MALCSVAYVLLFSTIDSRFVSVVNEHTDQ